MPERASEALSRVFTGNVSLPRMTRLDQKHCLVTDPHFRSVRVLLGSTRGVLWEVLQSGITVA